MRFFAVSQQCFGDDRIFGSRDLQVRPFAFAEKYSFPGQFDYRSVVGEFGPVFRFVGAAQQLGAEYLRRLDDAQAAAVDDLRSRAVRFAERIHRLDDRNRRAVFRSGRDRAPDQLLRPQRPHAVLHGDQLRIAFQGRQSVFHRVEPLPAPFGDRVRRHFETRRQIVPEAGVFGGQYDDDFRSGKRRGEVVDRARQYGHAPQQHELLGTRPSHAASAAARYDDDSSLSFHISFFPKPSVLSVSFI